MSKETVKMLQQYDLLQYICFQVTRTVESEISYRIIVEVVGVTKSVDVSLWNGFQDTWNVRHQ